MERDGSGVSALVGLNGFVVTAQLLHEATSEWWLAVETLEDRVWCETCRRACYWPWSPTREGA
jgi:hypothetical protein